MLFASRNKTKMEAVWYRSIRHQFWIMCRQRHILMQTMPQARQRVHKPTDKQSMQTGREQTPWQASGKEQTNRRAYKDRWLTLNDKNFPLITTDQALIDVLSLSKGTIFIWILSTGKLWCRGKLQTKSHLQACNLESKSMGLKLKREWSKWRGRLWKEIGSLPRKMERLARMNPQWWKVTWGKTKLQH